VNDQPVNLLRQAAAKLREYAGMLELGDVHGPWVVHAGPTGYPQSVCNVGAPVLICNTFTSPKAVPAEANWIALMHPGVGLALADWLDQAAKVQDAIEQDAAHAWRGSDDLEARDRWIDSRTNHRAVAVARAVVGGDRG
jgi:hypothetical protein